MLSIVYKDDDLAVISKPAGLLVHRSALDFYETENALKQLKHQLGLHVYPTHRLDKATSGALIFALNQPAAKAVNVAFDDRLVTKTYLGLVRGYTDDSGCIDYPLVKKTDRMTAKKQDDKPVEQEAVTNYTTLATVELPFAVGRYPSARYSLVELNPVTGRRHQIRRHMKHIFHPLVGDTTYGDGKHNTFFRDQFTFNRLLLHCYSMTFPHPTTGEPMTVTAPLDDELVAVLKQLGFNEKLEQMRGRP